MTAPAFGPGDVVALLAALNPDDRTEWIGLLRRAAANLSNAAYALAGNVPDAQPDPDTWAAGYLWLGAYQIDHALERLTPDREHDR